MNFFKKLIGKIKSFFIKDKIIYTYDKIRSVNKELTFLLDDIVKYNKHLDLLLKSNNFLEDLEYKNVLKISNDRIFVKDLLYWCSDKNKVLDNLDKEVHTFLKLSEELITKFNLLKELKKNEVEFKFNIRLIQPYIINLESIRGCIMKIT